MTCAVCKSGQIQPGTATVTLERDGTTVVIKRVPADICDLCGEYYLSDDIADWVYRHADAAALRHAEVEILNYAA